MIAQPIRVGGERTIVDANVILNSVMSAIMIVNGDRVHVTNNLVLSTHCMDFCAGCCGKWNVNVGNYDIVGNAETLTFTGNSAAGGVHATSWQTARQWLLLSSVASAARLWALKKKPMVCVDSLI